MMTETAATQATSASEPLKASEGNALTLTVSAGAVEAIAQQMKKRGTHGATDTALRVGIRGGGCSGFSYVIEFHDGPPHARDRVLDYVSAAGVAVRVVVDPKSLIYLNGTELDWEQTVMKRGFKFNNPQEKSKCGCGHSFTM